MRFLLRVFYGLCSILRPPAVDVSGLYWSLLIVSTLMMF